MPSASKAKPAGKSHSARSRPKPTKKPAPSRSPSKKPAPKAQPAPKSAAPKPAEAFAAPTSLPARGDGRRHLLSLSFLRDGDEFLARLETDAGQITELKNRSLDQLLTLVAGELEDLLE